MHNIAFGFYTLDQFSSIAYVHIRIPWWWHPASARTWRKERVQWLCL